MSEPKTEEERGLRRGVNRKVGFKMCNVYIMLSGM